MKHERNIKAVSPVPVQLDLLAPLPKVKRKDMTLGQRLDELTVKLANGCWEFKGYIEKEGTIGYGRMRFQGKRDYAHRWAYIEEHGSIPDGMQVRHVCNNPCCRRPAHLLAGTPQQNVDDMVQAKRGRGTLKGAEAVQIVAFHEKGRSVEHLAKQFKVSEITIRKVLSGKTHSRSTGIVFTPKHNHYDKVRKLKEAA
jgi:hypothetical protein